jgi:hypothetical protein
MGKCKMLMIYCKTLSRIVHPTLNGIVIKYFIYRSQLNLALHEATKIMRTRISKIFQELNKRKPTDYILHVS